MLPFSSLERVGWGWRTFLRIAGRSVQDRKWKRQKGKSRATWSQAAAISRSSGQEQVQVEEEEREGRLRALGNLRDGPMAEVPWGVKL